MRAADSLHRKIKGHYSENYQPLGAKVEENTVVTKVWRHPLAHMSGNLIDDSYANRLQ